MAITAVGVVRMAMDGADLLWPAQHGLAGSALRSSGNLAFFKPGRH